MAAFVNSLSPRLQSLVITQIFARRAHLIFVAPRRRGRTFRAEIWVMTRLQSRARLFSSHPESPRVEFAAHASLFRVYRQSPVNRGKELTCKAISSSAARTTA